MKINTKMNTIFKILTVIIIGYFIFELIFGIITGNFGLYGGESSGHNHHSSSSGGSPSYNYDLLVNALLIMIVKLMVVLLFLVLIAGAVMWIKDIWNSGTKPADDKQSGKKDMQSLLVVTSATFCILVLFSIFQGINYRDLDQNMLPGSFLGVSGSVLLGGFLNIIMYTIAIILGIEIFSYFLGKQNSDNKGSQDNTKGNP